MKNTKVECLSCKKVFSNKSLKGIHCPFCGAVNIDYVDKTENRSHDIRDSDVRRYKLIIILAFASILVILFTIEINDTLLIKITYHTVIKWMGSLIF